MNGDSQVSPVSLPVPDSVWQRLRRSLRERRVPQAVKRLVPDVIEGITRQNVMYVAGGRPRFLKFDLSGMSRAHQILDEVFNARVYFPTLDSRTAFAVRPGDTVIDIGANIGLFGTYAASLSRTGSVYCFEPASINFKRLEEHKRTNRCDNMVLFNKAVSGRPESLRLFILPDNCGAHTTVPEVEAGEGAQDRHYEVVDAVSLKQVFDDNRIDRCHFLKIDCEGAELTILSSLPPDYFNRIDRIALEYHPNVDVLELASLLDVRGFAVSIRGIPATWGMLFAMRKGA